MCGFSILCNSLRAVSKTPQPYLLSKIFYILSFIFVKTTILNLHKGNKTFYSYLPFFYFFKFSKLSLNTNVSKKLFFRELIPD